MFLWALVWLGGTAAVTGFSMTRHAPALEQAMLEGVQRAVAPLGDPPVTISMDDHAVTLAGTVPDADRRDALLAAAAAAPGVRNVTDRLVVREPLPPDIGAAENVGGDGDESGIGGGEREAGSGSVTPDDADVTRRMADAADRTPAPPSGTDRLDDAPLEEDLADADTPPEDPPTAPSPVVGDAPDGTTLGEGTPVTATAPVLPSLRFDIADGVLSIDGELSPADDPSAFIEAAMDSFELDFVSNAVERREGVADADWLAPLVSLLPALGRLEAPGVEVSERRVTLRGGAADRVTRDEVVEATLERLGDYALVERIVVRDAQPDASAERSNDEAPEADPNAETVTSEGPDGDGEPIEATKDTAPAPVDTPTERASTGDSVAAGSAGESPDDAPDSAPDEAPGEGEDDADRATAAAASASEASANERGEALLAELEALSSLRILFRSGSDRLTEESLDALDTIADTLRRHPDVPITIGGHTDSAGGTTVNLQLSQLRANAVREYLVSRDVQRERLIARGYGESLPIADNTTAEGRATNRRIEFTY